MGPLYIAGRKTGDKLILPMSPYVRAQLAKRPDGPIEAQIEWREPTRRARANRYYWGVVLKMMAEEMGETAEYIHELEKVRHNSRSGADFVDRLKPLTIPRSTATLTIEQFSRYLELVMRDGMEYLGIEFPPPTGSEDWR